MSFPCAATRLVRKNSVCPSRVSSGVASVAALFTGGPSTAGAPQGQSRHARCETQMLASFIRSSACSGRLELKYSVNPSFESDGCWSLNSVLIGAGSVTGIDQSEKPAEAMDATPGSVGPRCGSTPHPVDVRAMSAPYIGARAIVGMAVSWLAPGWWSPLQAE